MLFGIIRDNHKFDSFLFTANGCELTEKFMKFTLKILVAIIFALSGVVACYAQTPPPAQPPPPMKPARNVGNAKVFYFEKQNQTEANVYLYILGEVADIYQKKDVLTMIVGYKVAGNKATEPETVFLFLTSYSGEGLKYKENHKLTFYLDDKPLLSEDTVVRFSTYAPQKISSESFALEIKYKDFRRILKAKKVTLQFGQTKIDLKPETIAGLRDLNKTIEK